MAGNRRLITPDPSIIGAVPRELPDLHPCVLSPRQIATSYIYFVCPNPSRIRAFGNERSRLP
jgi:hypothetical protein